MITHEVFSKRQTVAVYSIQELTSLIEKEKVILREVNKLHVRALKKYLLENVSSEQIYFPPIVANAESLSPNQDKPDQFIIVDGTQRLKALCLLEEMAYKAIRSDNDEEIKIGYKLLYFFQHSAVSVLIFAGLTASECDQLYIDLNTKGKKVALSKRISFDSRSGLNTITNQVLKTNCQLKIAGVEDEKRAVVRPKNKNLLSLTQLRQIVGIFLTGKMVYRTTEDSFQPYLQGEEYVRLLNTWFDELFACYPAERIGDFRESMIANTPLLMSIAYYANKGLEKYPFIERKNEMLQRMKPLRTVNWQRSNPIWQQFKGTSKGRDGYFYLSNEKETIESLVEWLKKQGR
ncbi:DNA sulfur modification protein DndB [Bacillota bacterium Lsc_1132]